MITGIHAITYTGDPDATREFLRDVLQLPSVDAGGGWPIFALPPAELAAHPTDGPARHELYLMCDEFDATVRELAAKGVVFSEPVSEQSWGRVTAFQLPGGARIGLYEPRHPSPLEPAD